MKMSPEDLTPGQQVYLKKLIWRKKQVVRIDWEGKTLLVTPREPN